MATIKNNLKAVRERAGLSAAALATQAGVTRQSIHAMEAGTYVPNTAVALTLARTLGVSVEQLFTLDEAASQTVSAEYLNPVSAAWPGQPLQLAEVGGRAIAVPATPAPYYLSAVDGLVESVGRGRALRASTFADAVTSDRVVIAGCDPAATLIQIPAVHVPASSKQALQWLKDGLVHAAGSHLYDNSAAARKLFPKGGVAVVTFATWEEGLAIAAGNPKSIKGVEDLARKDVRIVNREPGAAIRTMLEEKLKTAGVPASRVQGYNDVAYGHLASAWMVAFGVVDCCLATRVAAQVFGLTFLPLAAAQYDLITLAEHAGPMREFTNALAGSALRRKIEGVAGYDTAAMGSSVSW